MRIFRPQGAVGLHGYDGQPGRNGPPGIKGEMGPRGFPGVQGDAVSTTSQGHTGSGVPLI